MDSSKATDCCGSRKRVFNHSDQCKNKPYAKVIGCKSINFGYLYNSEKKNNWSRYLFWHFAPIAPADQQRLPLFRASEFITRILRKKMWNIASFRQCHLLVTALIEKSSNQGLKKKSILFKGWKGIVELKRLLVVDFIFFLRKDHLVDFNYCCVPNQYPSVSISFFKRSVPSTVRLNGALIR